MAPCYFTTLKFITGVWTLPWCITIYGFLEKQVAVSTKCWFCKVKCITMSTVTIYPLSPVTHIFAVSSNSGLSIHAIYSSKSKSVTTQNGFHFKRWANKFTPTKIMFCKKKKKNVTLLTHTQVLVILSRFSFTFQNYAQQQKEKINNDGVLSSHNIAHNFQVKFPLELNPFSAN